MSDTSTSTSAKVLSARPPLWRDAVVLKWVTQVFLLFVVLAALWFLTSQAGDNLQARSIPSDFDFIERPVDIQLSEGIDTHPDSGGRALWVGMVNTIRISIVGIIFATILGIIVGLARLSNNWLVNRLGTLRVHECENLFSQK